MRDYERRWAASKMKKSKKLITFVLIAVFVILMIPTGVIAGTQVFGRVEANLGRVAPPIMNTNNEQELVLVEPDPNNDKMIFGNQERNFCLGYLDNFKAETVTGGEGAEEAARITRKNALLQEYRAYVDRLYDQKMTIGEYDNHYAHLMDIFFELLPLEPEKTPQEKFEIQLQNIISRLKEDLYYSEVHGEMYIEERKLNIPQLKKCIEEFTALQNKIAAKQLSFEQMQQEYTLYLERVKTASPYEFSAATSPEEEENS